MDVEDMKNTRTYGRHRNRKAVLTGTATRNAAGRSHPCYPGSLYRSRNGFLATRADR